MQQLWNPLRKQVRTRLSGHHAGVGSMQGNPGGNHLGVPAARSDSRLVATAVQLLCEEVARSEGAESRSRPRLAAVCLSAISDLVECEDQMVILLTPCPCAAVNNICCGSHPVKCCVAKW